MDHSSLSREFYPRNGKIVQLMQIKICNVPHKHMKNKSHMIISINSEKEICQNPTQIHGTYPEENRYMRISADSDTSCL